GNSTKKSNFTQKRSAETADTDLEWPLLTRAWIDRMKRAGCLPKLSRVAGVIRPATRSLMFMWRWVRTMTQFASSSGRAANDLHRFILLASRPNSNRFDPTNGSCRSSGKLASSQKEFLRRTWLVEDGLTA